jgi:hypothetical protein
VVVLGVHDLTNPIIIVRVVGTGTLAFDHHLLLHWSDSEILQGILAPWARVRLGTSAVAWGRGRTQPAIPRTANFKLVAG